MDLPVIVVKPSEVTVSYANLTKYSVKAKISLRNPSPNQIVAFAIKPQIHQAVTKPAAGFLFPKETSWVHLALKAGKGRKHNDDLVLKIKLAWIDKGAVRDTMNAAKYIRGVETSKVAEEQFTMR